MNIRKPEAKSAINQFRKFLVDAGIEVPLNLMQEGFARSQGFDDWQAYSAYDAASRRMVPMVEPEVVPGTEPGSRLKFTGKVGEAVWVRMPSTGTEGGDISVYLKRGDEGVSVDLYASEVEDSEALAGTSLSYSEAGSVEDMTQFDENGRKPMLWSEMLGSPDALRFGEGLWQPIDHIVEEALVLADAVDHPHAAARDVFPEEYFAEGHRNSWDGRMAFLFLNLERSDEDGLFVAELRGAQVDRKGVIYLKDGRRMEFIEYGKK